MRSTNVPEACSRFLSAVGDLVSGEPVMGASEHHAHRAGCSSCAAEFDLATHIHSDLATLPEMEPPASMWTALQPRLDEVDLAPVRKRERVPALVPRLVRSPARG